MTATDLARRVVDALLAAGVRHVVLAPGSRNAPLSFALYDAAGAGALTLHTRIDERTAAFVALGIAKNTLAPAVVLTTSGTAAANLHPAMLEAAHSGVRLVAVTADRPARLRGTLANQTTDQTGLYGGAAVTLDADDSTTPDQLAALLGGAGPVHLNVQLDEPLVPADRYVPGLFDHVESARERSGEAPVVLGTGPRTVVVAGDDAGPGARILAQDANWPLLAEPSSGSRNGPNPIRTYRLLLGTALGERIERAVVYGAPTLSRPVQRLLERPGLEVVARSLPGRWRERPHPVTRTCRAPIHAGGSDDPGWLDEWHEADRALGARIDALVADEPGLTPYDVAAAVNAALPADGLLYVGASNPIRDLDLMALPYGPGQHHKVLANRGLAGIDGTLSSAIGATLSRPRTSRAFCYVGDVTFLHDMTALVIGPGEVLPNLTVVVANDDGGSIFATLEQGAPEHAASFDKLFGTPHGVDVGALCAATRTPHWRVTDRAELEHALASPNGGIEVVEALVRRDDRRDLDARIRALAT